MGDDETFLKKVYEIITELKIPLIDQTVLDKAKFSSNKAIVNILFKFEEDESVIRGFIGLAEYFHTVIIKDKNKFYIPTTDLLLKLENT